MTILKKLIDEVCATFDVPYIHIGTDEVKFTNPEFVLKWSNTSGQRKKSFLESGWNYQPRNQM